MTERKNLFELSAKDPVELSSLNMKSKLLTIINLSIKSKGMSQKDAAEFLKTSQPRVSNLKNGVLSKFSIDFLLDCLVKLGYNLDIVFDPTNLDTPMQISFERENW